MKYFLLSLVLLVIAPSALLSQSDLERKQNYIDRFREIAIQEMERAGIPASIKLAQGLLESGAGTSQLARNANNHFGIKCGSNWNGKEIYREDDDYDNEGRLIKSCFRGYRNANASFVAHSEFLRDPKKAFRYGFLFRLNPRDYKRWAEGLRRAGYATDPNYPEKLIGIIERYNLEQYDRLPINNVGGEPAVIVTRPGSTRPLPTTRPTDVNTPIENLVTGFLNTNDVTYFVSDEAISVDEVARRVDISLRKLIEYNEPIASGTQQVLPGQRVFIQKKRRSYRGRQSDHTVQPGETLQDISDRYAIRMDKLLKRNRLVSPDQRVAAGEKIKLRGSKVKEAPQLGGTPMTQPDSPTVPTDEDGNLEMDESNQSIDADEEKPPVIVPVPSTTIPNPNRPTVGNQPDFGNPPPPPPVNPNPPVRPDVDPQPAPPYTPPVTNPTPPPNTPPVTNPTPPPNTPPAVQPTLVTYTVVKGDTLYSISRRYGMTVDRVKQLNGLTSNTISIGQQLKVQ